jgi:putative tryptophan/tyrosine transport system substrate-binding protein
MRRRDIIITLLGGAAVLRPITVRAQRKAVPVIGFLVAQSYAPPAASHYRATGVSPADPDPFSQGLRENGYVDGQTVTIDYRFADGAYDRLPGLAAEFAERKVDLIAAIGTAAADAAKNATSTIPIVFFSEDPIAEGLAASLARPGGNLTGISLLGAELMPKRLELLSELVPQAKAFALLVHPKARHADATIRRTQGAADAKGVTLHVLKAGTVDEIGAAFATLRQLDAGGLIVDTDPLFVFRRHYILALASLQAVPAMYGRDIFAWNGGLLSYGPSSTTAVRQVGIYAGKILKGAKPADLPVEQPTKFELVINLKTARALGLTVPPALLARADEVIE